MPLLQGAPRIYPFQGCVVKLRREMRSSGNNRKLNSCPYHMGKSLMAEFSCSATQEIHWKFLWLTMTSLHVASQGSIKCLKFSSMWSLPIVCKECCIFEASKVQPIPSGSVSQVCLTEKEPLSHTSPQKCGTFSRQRSLKLWLLDLPLHTAWWNRPHFLRKLPSRGKNKNPLPVSLIPW